MTNFNTTLFEVMAEKKMNVKEFAIFLGFKDSTFRDVLRSENIMLRNALKIVDKLGASLDYFERKTKTFHCKYKKGYHFDICTTVKSYLKENKVTYIKLCEDLKISKANMSRWKLGADPKYQTIVKLAEYFNVSIDKFVGRI